MGTISKISEVPCYIYFYVDDPRGGGGSSQPSTRMTMVYQGRQTDESLWYICNDFLRF